MLCQLVCIDRRYQRMNCFNIREIQSLLKRKFFTDLINTHDHHTLLDKTAMGLRFKTNNINSINSNIFVFYNYGIEFAPKIRTSNYSFSNEINFNEINSFNHNSVFYTLINFFLKSHIFSLFNNFYLSIFNNLLHLSSCQYLFVNSINKFITSTLYFLESGLSSASLFYNFTSITSIFLSNCFKNLNFFLEHFYVSHFQIFSPLSNNLTNSTVLDIFSSIKLPNLSTIQSFNINFSFIKKINFFNLFEEFFFIIKFLETFHFYKNFINRNIMT